MRLIEELILVYNADAGLVSALIDSGKKVLTLNGCTLCAITHGIAGERAEWQECKTTFGVPIRYFHRDDLPAEVQAVTGGRLPCVIARVEGAYELLLTPESLERCNGKVADLKRRLRHNAALKGMSLPAARG